VDWLNTLETQTLREIRVQTNRGSKDLYQTESDEQLTRSPFSLFIHGKLRCHCELDSHAAGDFVKAASRESPS